MQADLSLSSRVKTQRSLSWSPALLWIIAQNKFVCTSETSLLSAVRTLRKSQTMRRMWETTFQAEETAFWEPS